MGKLVKLTMAPSGQASNITLHWVEIKKDGDPFLGSNKPIICFGKIRVKRQHLVHGVLRDAGLVSCTSSKKISSSQQ